jgi:hypothetical protein
MTPDYQEQIKAILLEYTLGPKLAKIYDKASADILMNEPRAQKALAAINALNKEAIGQHLPGCPYITKYTGPEGEPYDGPACDCGVLDMRRRFGVEGEKKV